MVRCSYRERNSPDYCPVCELCEIQQGMKGSILRGGVHGGSFFVFCTHIFFDGWLWLRSGGRGGLFGLLEFQGLEIDQVCKEDAFRHRACLGDDIELFGVCCGYVGIDQYLFRSALSDGGDY